MSLNTKLRKSIFYIIVLFLLTGIFTVNHLQTLAQNYDRSDTHLAQENGAKTVEVILQRHYLDGEISEEVVEETIWSMEDFWSFYEDWQLVDQNEQKIIFMKEFNDISPLLKMNGYFGLSDDDTLSIFNGKPNDSEVIQSFFQVNTSRLKSHLRDELLEGIPISSKDHYLEVIKMVEEFAVKEM
ncbi:MULTISPECIES: intercompartmental signaling factor BofC [Bacillaceae]|uniref:Intercompartmental signaling factor BofC n=1 Tax=Evansella alkalicola TaxID=745819 RepID=A0ABS6JTX8_9BACI|nr:MULTISPECIES: intercompartmental signaling factor BofC [Bacillaceae]MBU9720702.1 intercompartmental signaling factor BofC [Bacillus alkalicola]